MPNSTEQAETPDNIFEIPGENVPAFRKKMDSLIKRASKLGCGTIAYRELSTRTTAQLRCSACGGHTGQDCYPRCNMAPTNRVDVWHTFEVTGDAPQLPGGWKMLAKIEPLADGVNVVSTYPGAEGLDPEWATCALSCEHCNTERRRKNSFVLRNAEGETKLVGKTCIKDFLGHHDPRDVLRYASYLHAAVAMGSDEEFSTGRAPSTALHLETVLVLSAFFIRTVGWVSRGRAYDEGLEATADTMMAAINSQAAIIRTGPTDEDRARGAEALAFAVALDFRTEQNDYLRNVAAVAEAGYVTRNTVGIACSIPIALQHAENRAKLEAEKAAEDLQNGASEYVGTVGQREYFTVTYERSFGFDTDFGYLYIHKFRDQSGNVVVWKSGSDTDTLTPDQHELVEGETVEIKATVKEHSEYRDVKQTIVNRATWDIPERACPVCGKLHRKQLDGDVCGKRCAKKLAAKANEGQEVSA